MPRYLCNAFSLNMLPPGDAEHALRVRPLTLAAARALAADATSTVGHADTAVIFASVLGLPVPCARTTLRVEPGDELLVGQYDGPRLALGATTLPEGASIRWMLVSVTDAEAPRAG